MQGAHGVGDEPGRDEQDQDAGPAEEDAQVEFHAQRIDGVADDGGEQEAEPGAERRRPAGILLEDGEQEEDRFQPLAHHGEEGEPDQCEALMLPGQRRIDAGLQFALDRARSLAHPEHHRGQHRGGDEPDDGLEQFLPALRQFAGDDVERGPGRKTDGAGKGDADPQRRQPFAPPAPDQIARDDADDQRGFHAFAQHDEERYDHGEPATMRVAGAAVRGTDAPCLGTLGAQVNRNRSV